jgi:hypothetical protein
LNKYIHTCKYFTQQVVVMKYDFLPNDLHLVLCKRLFNRR